MGRKRAVEKPDLIIRDCGIFALRSAAKVSVPKVARLARLHPRTVYKALRRARELLGEPERLQPLLQRRNGTS